MKKFAVSFVIAFSVVCVMSILFTGCSRDNSSAPTSVVSESSNDNSSVPTSVVPETGTARIEGQIVADAGTQFAKLSSSDLTQDLADSPGPIYPVSGATVELLQNGNVIATTTTDEYGRFQFSDLEPGEYDVRVDSDDGAVAHYHVSVAANQTMTVYGRVLSEECLWAQEDGPHWEDMPHGSSWGDGFRGASPGPGYWHDGERWCEPQSGTPQGTGPHGAGGPHH